MSTQVITAPPILDSTGQDIVTGLSGIANAVQPINIYLDVEMSIPVEGWSETVPHRYTWLYQRITTECGVDVYFIDGADDVDMKFIEYEKVPGGIQFEIDEIPDAAIPLMVRIINAQTTAVIDPVDSSLVTESAVPQTANVHEAMANHEGRISASEESIENINESLENVDEELQKRLKSVNSIPPDEDGDVKVIETEFARQIVTDDAQQSSGEFLFRTTGGDASLSDGPAKLVSIQGRSEHTGIVEEVLNLVVNPATREEGQVPIMAEIDRDTFVEEVTESSTITLSFTSSWSEDPATYGVTVTGTPISGDSIVITYVKANRGTITVSNPSKFISTEWNLYNNASDKKYAKVKKYSSEYGFLIGGAYATLTFKESPEDIGITITPVDGYFIVPSDGYVYVSGGDATTYILMTWSDWTEGYEGDFNSYSETVVDIAAIINALPSGVLRNGMYQVGAICDEINFSMERAISRIERLTYTEQNLEYAEASGRDYEADEDYIYLVKAVEDVYVISETGAYTASDHGLEIIEGGTIPVYVQTLYGQNLVDKLRTDVVTKSQDIVNNLTDGGTNKALSAEMGKQLSNKLTTQSGSVNDDKLQTYSLYKNNKTVYFSGITAACSLSAGTWYNITKLPSGFRPANQVDFMFVAPDNKTGVARIDTDGTVKILAASSISIDANYGARLCVCFIVP